MHKVTIVIPVYNAEAYVAECVESVLRQTYRDIEVVLVDDGSKDGSLGVCRGLAEKDERVKVGVIAEVDESTINTVATLEDGRMIPLHEDFITEIDEAARVLYVRLPFEI